MRIARVTLFDVEAMHLFPRLGIRTGQDDDRCGGVHHVSVRATAKRQVELVLESHEVGERIVFAVGEGPSHIRDADARKLNARRLARQAADVAEYDRQETGHVHNRWLPDHSESLLRTHQESHASQRYDQHAPCQFLRNCVPKQSRTTTFLSQQGRTCRRWRLLIRCGTTYLLAVSHCLRASRATHAI